MTRHILACLSLTTLACHASPSDPVEDFRSGVPRQETVTVEGPSKQGQALTSVGAQSQALRGGLSDSALLTVGVTAVINGGAVFVGALVKTIVLAVPPTSLTADAAVWGPFAAGLDPVTWKVTVTKVAEHQFQWRFEGRPRLDPTARFVTVLSGTHTAAADGNGDNIPGFGDGSFTIDWDARATLPLPDPRQVGMASYSYSRQSGAATTVSAQFRQVLDDKDRRVDIDYAYHRQAGQGGSVDFVDSAAAQAGLPAGRWSFRTRWMAGGSGRTDARASASGTTVTASECWNAAFLSTFLVHSWEPAAGYGSEATDCSFPTADYSSL
jgi:hypothetical protein